MVPNGKGEVAATADTLSHSTPRPLKACGGSGWGSRGGTQEVQARVNAQVRCIPVAGGRERAWSCGAAGTQGGLERVAVRSRRHPRPAPRACTQPDADGPSMQCRPSLSEGLVRAGCRPLHGSGARRRTQGKTMCGREAQAPSGAAGRVAACPRRLQRCVRPPPGVGGALEEPGGAVCPPAEHRV